MSFLKSLPAEGGLLQIFQAFREAARPLLEYHEVLLRGDSPFSAAERELIAAYVSDLNDCHYCRAVHFQTAVALGIGADTIANLFSGSREEHVRHGRNPPDWRIDHRMRPVLAFVGKLTLSPGSITAADVDAIFAAGWDDRALHDATAICGLFNLTNRLVNGLGIEAPESYIRLAAQRLAQSGYAQLLNLLPASNQKPSHKWYERQTDENSPAF
jgi:uncharacterized peroxidase-related enzyme